MLPMATEHQEQTALFDWAEVTVAMYPQLRLMYAVPNGGDRNPVVAAKLKAEGVKPGVPDLVLPVARGPYFGFYGEMKRRATYAKPSPEQLVWLQDLQLEGYYTCWHRGWEDMRDALLWYLNLGPYRGNR